MRQVIVVLPLSSRSLRVVNDVVGSIYQLLLASICMFFITSPDIPIKQLNICCIFSCIYPPASTSTIQGSKKDILSLAFFFSLEHESKPPPSTVQASLHDTFDSKHHHPSRLLYCTHFESPTRPPVSCALRSSLHCSLYKLCVRIHSPIHSFSHRN